MKIWEEKSLGKIILLLTVSSLVGYYRERIIKVSKKRGISNFHNMKLKLNSNSYIFDLFSLSLKVWCKFIKFEEVFVNNWAYKKSFSNKSYVFAFWHDEIFPLTYFYRNRGIYAIVSPSRDGEILAGVLKRWGYNLFRGSSDKTPIKLLKEIIKKKFK